MNLSEIISNTEKAITTKNILKENGSATLIKIQKNALLDNHQSRINAVLVLLSGKAIYEEEDRKIILSKTNDFVKIPEKVTHKVKGEEDTLLLLIQ